jgi:hypothetical protein
MRSSRAPKEQCHQNEKYLAHAGLLAKLAVRPRPARRHAPCHQQRQHTRFPFLPQSLKNLISTSSNLSSSRIPSRRPRPLPFPKFEFCNAGGSNMRPAAAFQCRQRLPKHSGSAARGASISTRKPRFLVSSSRGCYLAMSGYEALPAGARRVHPELVEWAVPVLSLGKSKG